MSIIFSTGQYRWYAYSRDYVMFADARSLACSHCSQRSSWHVTGHAHLYTFHCLATDGDFVVQLECKDFYPPFAR